MNNTVMVLPEITSVGLLGLALVIVAGSLPVLKWYSNWRQNVESIEQRQNALIENLEGKVFRDGVNTYEVRQVDYIEEKDSWSYNIRKQIPIFRKLKGKSRISIRAKMVIGRRYVWRSDDIGIDFKTYLEEIISDDLPKVDYIKTENVVDTSAGVGTTTETQLDVHSIDSSAIAKTLEKVPEFHSYYFNNYPGDNRYSTPY